ncbi:hypothetical protein KXD93_16640 [Mucilaginibacter sp. BJC16-A38]|uniref:hypothetical protein n=1 Tax=Mucilaginibacter phenanthrenivorans TaxID=1234842 RepID=UPI002157AF22|nr:hypothetical protein [Mucilaginibacter phenanthrenivorans]MCR8559287.1 hypothetical protein [Mucilaginibacter phenanthrenivorans]
MAYSHILYKTPSRSLGVLQFNAIAALDIQSLYNKNCTFVPMGVGLSRIEKNLVIVEATKSILGSYYKLFRPTDDAMSLFRYEGENVRTDNSSGFKGYTEQILTDFTANVPRLSKKKRTVVLQCFENLMQTMYELYIPQHGDGTATDTNWGDRAAVYHALDDDTIDIDTFRREFLDTFLWKLL